MLVLSATLSLVAVASESRSTGGPKPPVGCTTVRKNSLPRFMALLLLVLGVAATDPNSCPCPILHPGTPGTFCPLDKTPGQCSKPGPHKKCKAGGTCPHCPNCGAPAGCRTVLPRGLVPYPCNISNGLTRCIVCCNCTGRWQVRDALPGQRVAAPEDSPESRLSASRRMARCRWCAHAARER